MCNKYCLIFSNIALVILRSYNVAATLSLKTDFIVTPTKLVLTKNMSDDAISRFQQDNPVHPRCGNRSCDHPARLLRAKSSRRPATRFVSYYRCTFLGPSAGIRRTQLKIASTRIQCNILLSLDCVVNQDSIKNDA